MKYLSTITLCACCVLTSPTVLASPEHASHANMDHTQADAPSTTPYTLNTCVISGEALGSMGDAIVKVYEGREVKFCCAMCIPEFEKDIKASLANLDQQIIDEQLKFYPTTNCLVSDEPLTGEKGMDDPVNFVHNGRLIRLCCNMCRIDFDEDPQAYIAKLDQAVIAQQSEHYPLTTCPISGEALGSMGDSIDIVYAGRLVKFCCAMCIPEFESDPMPTIAKIDSAWMAMHKNDPAHNKSGHHDD